MIETDIVNNFLKRLAKNNPASKDLNDDVFFDKKRKLVISIDTYNEGIHFQDFNNPYFVAKKIIRSSISDLICKGVEPKYYFISASGRKGSFKKKKLAQIIKSLSHEQKLYNIKISGGDTTLAKNVSFTVISVGFSKKIIERNKAKISDDIYVTGNIGDSYIGLNIIKKKIKNIDAKLKKYFLNKYYMPILPFKFTKVIKSYANSSIDISDGLILDLLRLINNQKLHFKIFLDKIPVSKNFNNYIKMNKLDKKKFLFNGDDYQVIFTASKKFRKQIIRRSKLMNQKLSIIGEITPEKGKNHFIDGNISLNLSNYNGYLHHF